MPAFVSMRLSITIFPAGFLTATEMLSLCKSIPIYLLLFIEGRSFLSELRTAQRTYYKGASLSHGPKISRYEARRATFLRRHDLQDYGKLIKSESGAIQKG